MRAKNKFAGVQLNKDSAKSPTNNQSYKIYGSNQTGRGFNLVNVEDNCHLNLLYMVGARLTIKPFNTQQLKGLIHNERLA